jgi:hypothetical protein
LEALSWLIKKPVVPVAQPAITSTTLTPKSYKDCGVIGAAVGDALNSVGEYIGSQKRFMGVGRLEKSLTKLKPIFEQLLDGIKNQVRLIAE